MTDFVIVVAALANLASANPAATPVAPVPENAPTVGFRTYATVESCEDAAAHLAARPGTRLVCLPIEANDAALADAY